MPRQRCWLVIEYFEFMPRPSVVMVFRPGDVRCGLTRACREKAGDRIREVRE